MKLSNLLSLLLLQGISAVSGQGSQVSFQDWPLHDDGLNHIMQWDHYSLMFKGKRLFIWSGEMHYWRVPVPELWIDILQKIKAAGFNTVSLYAHWGYHNAKDGELDFESGAHNFERIFDLAKQVGLYVMFRPGPYVNAESNAGALPGWVTTGAYGSLRNNDTRYTKAWTPYFEKMTQTVARHQITKGGNVFMYQIENEYWNQWLDPDKKTPNATGIAYMELLEASARKNGIDVPLFANNPNMWSRSWSKDYAAGVPGAGGNADIYGLDHYPSCWSCNLEECSGVNGVVPEFTVFDYYNNFQETAPTQPSFLTEFQGGSYNPWGGPEGGCTLTDATWANVFYRHNLAQKVSAVNLYMLFGGTSWGAIPYPNVGTSYDYSAPISENRNIGSKYSETKILGLFFRVARGLTKVERIGNGTMYTNNPAIWTTELLNVDGDGAFYVTRHVNSPSEGLDVFSLSVSTSKGNMTIPKYAPGIILNGRASKIIVTDFAIGNQKLVYSTAEILTYAVLDGLPTVIFWVPAGESGEFFLKDARLGTVVKCDGCADVKFNKANGGLITSFTQAEGMSVLEFDNGVRALIVDRSVAYGFWAPVLSNDPFSPEDQTVLVHGPYLVREASVSGKTVNVKGDWLNSTTVEVFASRPAQAIIMNGVPLKTEQTLYGSLVGTVQASGENIASILAKLPSLSGWKAMDSMPELRAEYDDSKWTAANHMKSPAFAQPETFPALYADEYGFHSNSLLWRGRFTGNDATGVYLRLIGGVNFGWSAFLNGKYIGSYLGASFVNDPLPSHNLTHSFANATLHKGENVLFIVQDNMGKDQTTGAIDPRGILNATLIGSDVKDFTSWKVAGTAGGETNIDPVRGPYNEGGHHSDRMGWHLPGFDDRKWPSGVPETGLSAAGAMFYRQTVKLDIPHGIDISLGFKLTAPPGSKLRAQLYVNGYMFAKFIPWIGNQVSFPVFPGILDYHGENTIGLNVWAQDAAGASMTVQWEVLGVYQSSFDPGFNSTYLRPGWKDRSEYA